MAMRNPNHKSLILSNFRFGYFQFRRQLILISQSNRILIHISNDFPCAQEFVLFNFEAESITLQIPLFTFSPPPPFLNIAGDRISRYRRRLRCVGEQAPFLPRNRSAVSSDLSRFRSPEKADSILTFLESNCFSSNQLQRLARSEPRFLTAAVEDDIKLKISIFRDFGFSPKETAKVISSNRGILGSSAEKKIAPQLSALKELLGSDRDAVALEKRSAWYMTADLKKSLLPNIEFLRSCGVSRDSIRIMMFNFPRSVLLRPEVMSEVVEKVREMGIEPGEKVFVYALRARASLREESWEMKMRGFRELGVSEGEVLAMFRQFPTVVCTSLEKMREVTRVVVATGRYGVRDLVGVPYAFLCSVEKRFEPRLRILGILERRGVVKKWPALSAVARWSNDRFAEVFVRPYLDQLGEDCVVAFKGEERSKN